MSEIYLDGRIVGWIPFIIGIIFFIWGIYLIIKLQLEASDDEVLPMIAGLLFAVGLLMTCSFGFYLYQLFYIYGI